MTTPTSTPASQIAQARAAAYTLIAAGFQCPTGALIDSLADPQHWADWPDVLKDLDARIAKPLLALRHKLCAEASLLAGGSDGDADRLQHRQDELFGHAVRGQCPPFEMEYGRHEIIRQAADLADLAGFYRAFGLDFADGRNGRPDHITAECEFMGVLCAKQAHALRLGDDENVDICVNAQRAFLRDHLACWLPAFAHRILQAEPDGLYADIARFADTFVETESDRFEMEAGPATLELNPADPVLDRNISCGPTDCGDQQSGEQFVQLSTQPQPNQAR